MKPYFPSLVLVSLVLLAISPGRAETAETRWSAQWIGPETACSNSWICFRKTVRLNSTLPTFRARIAADSKYWLWINGQLVVFEGGLKRGPSPQDTYYDEVEIGPWLKRGENSIAVLVWYWGRSGFSHNSSGKAGLLFDAASTEHRIVTDPSWKIKVHPAYEDSGPPYPNYRLSEFNISFDARKDLKDWTRTKYDDADWTEAKAFGIPPVSPWNQLEKRPIYQWKDSGLKAYANVLKSAESNGVQFVKATLPYNAQITPFLKVRAPAGQRIEIQTDNYRGGGSPNVRAAYITQEGVQEFESLGWMNGHEVQYRAPDTVKFLNVKYRETGYNADFAGAFRCDDKELNQLWEKSRRTLYVTMRDNYMDCPDRERAQWWGDAVNELGEAFYVFDATKGPLLVRKAMLELAQWRRNDGSLYSPVPAGHSDRDVRKDMRDGNWNSELPAQMLASVGWYGFWTYYLYTGDQQALARVYPAARDYLKLWQWNADGLVIHRPGDWDWMDWGRNIDAEVLENAWYYLALKAAIATAPLAGFPEDVVEWRERQTSIARNFNAKFWTGQEYRSKNYSGDTDDRANALAVVAGLADKSQHPQLRQVLSRHFNASPYMEKYVLEALFQMNDAGQGLGRMRQRWQNQITNSITTLYEGWDVNAKGNTYNHAWSGGALTILSQYAAGVAPTQPGFKQYQVLPQLGDLKFVSAVVSAPQGDIRLEIRKRSKQLEMQLTSPPGTTAVVGIPREAGQHLERLKVNRTIFQSRGGETRKIPGCVYLGEDEQFVRLQLSPGRWQLQAIFK